LYPYGSIVIVSDLSDPQGRNPKDRRCVVITPDSEPRHTTGTIDVVAISWTYPIPLPADHIPIPYRHPFHPVTGCVSPCVAVCPWNVEVEISRISLLTGRIKTPRVPARQMILIAQALRSLG